MPIEHAIFPDAYTSATSSGSLTNWKVSGYDSTSLSVKSICSIASLAMSEYSGVEKFSADLRQGTQTDQNCPPTAPTHQN